MLIVSEIINYLVVVSINKVKWFYEWFILKCMIKKKEVKICINFLFFCCKKYLNIGI